jgi:hypothetical protein
VTKLPDNLTDEFKELLAVFKQHGIVEAEASYSGGGDEGYTDFSHFWAESGRYNGNIEDKIVRQFEDFAFKISAINDGGWWNNDGGRGEVYIDVEAGAIRIEHSNFYTETDSFEYEFEL